MPRTGILLVSHLPDETNEARRFGLDDAEKSLPPGHFLALRQQGDIARRPVDHIDEPQAISPIEVPAIETLQTCVVPELDPAFGEDPRRREQIPERLVVRERNAAGERPRVRVDADEKDPGVPVAISDHRPRGRCGPTHGVRLRAAIAAASHGRYGDNSLEMPLNGGLEDVRMPRPKYQERRNEDERERHQEP